MPEAALPAKWNRLNYHKEQAAWWASNKRFDVVPAGRRSGKTEIAKRKGEMRALKYTAASDGWIVFSAPTHAQAKRIFWKDLKSMTPAALQRRQPSESELTIFLVNGVDMTVLGMDKPERIEGRPLDGIVLDEYGNMKASVWEENVRPALSTLGRPGWAIFTGVPEGRNHYYNLAIKAQSEDRENWGYHHWISADILDPKEIAEAKRDMDELTYLQEYEASFINFSGRAYYAFERSTHCGRTTYDQDRPLVFCFDFNISPAICVIVQESVALDLTMVIGEVHIPRNGNTEAVCRRLIQDWGNHRGTVLCYGDATGGAGGSAKVRGSDWDIIQEELRVVFRDRLRMRVPRGNPPERVRVNAMNSRLKNVAGDIRLMIDEPKAPFLVNDLEGVTLLQGGSGEIDKKRDETITHLSDALGYYIQKEHAPLSKTTTTSVSI